MKSSVIFAPSRSSRDLLQKPSSDFGRSLLLPKSFENRSAANRFWTNVFAASGIWRKQLSFKNRREVGFFGTFAKQKITASNTFPTGFCDIRS